MCCSLNTVRLHQNNKRKKNEKKANCRLSHSYIFPFGVTNLLFELSSSFGEQQKLHLMMMGKFCLPRRFLANFWASLNSSLHVASHSPCFYDLWITSPFIYCCIQRVEVHFLNFSETYATKKTWLFISDQSDGQRREKFSLLAKFQKFLELKIVKYITCYRVKQSVTIPENWGSHVRAF